MCRRSREPLVGLRIGNKLHTTCGISVELLSDISAAKSRRPFASLQALNHAFVRALNYTSVVGIMITPIAVQYLLSRTGSRQILADEGTANAYSSGQKNVNKALQNTMEAAGRQIFSPF